MVISSELDSWMDLPNPSGDQIARYNAIRAAAVVFSAAIMDNSPAGSERTAATGKVRDAVILAGIAISYEKQKDK